MVSLVRSAFNAAFTQEKYEAFLTELDAMYPGAVQFRLAETPVFVPKYFTRQMLETCEYIVDQIKDSEFRTLTQRSIPEQDKVGGAFGLPQTLVFDFGICKNSGGDIVPQLVEMQGFPSLYAFQDVFPAIMRKHLPVPEGYTQFLGNHDQHSYRQLLREVLLGRHAPEHVILLEIKPHEQKTRVDFYLTEKLTGIRPVCITELQSEGKQLFYEREGQRTRVARIYNRVIFDELNARKDIYLPVDIRMEYNVEWVPHPDWFYRISKFTLPLLRHEFIPETFFLHEIKQLPTDLDQYVLKPLFSFAGQGVVIDIEEADLRKISDPQNWILQKKVQYADIIHTPEGDAKAEIRIMYLWRDGAERPEPVINLARISRGKMIGTRYNKGMSWVGGSVAFFEP